MKLRLGELLVLEGVLTQGQILKALDRQKIMGGRLGTNLLELKFLSEYEVSTTLAKQHGLPPVPLGALDDVPPQIIGLIPQHLVEKHLIIPFGRDGGKLQVASPDPLDIRVLETLSFVTRSPIKVHLCPEARIHYAIHHYYGLPAKFRFLVLFQIKDGDLKKERAPVPQRPPVPQPVAAAEGGAPASSSAIFIGRTFSRPAPEAAELPAEAETFNEDDLEPFLSPISMISIMSTVMERLAELCDRAIIYHIDGREVRRWDSKNDFTYGREGTILAPSIVMNSFIFRYLPLSNVFCGPLPDAPQTTAIIGAFGGIVPQEAVLLPFATGAQQGYVILGDNLVSSRKIESLPKIKRIYAMGVCGVKIHLLRVKIKSLAY